MSAPALHPHSGTLAAGQRLGRYEVLAKLAAGGMAAVYVGRTQGLAGFERLVALKVLHYNFAHEEEFIRMFLDEARLAARIRHPNVVPTIDIEGSADRGYFLVMEYIEGDHLGALLSAAHRTHDRLPRQIALRIVCDVAQGLGAAHELRDESGRPLSIVHRDVSPHNIMVGRDGIARLTDFGVAKAEDRLTHTRDGQIKGKLAYMAPEQASSGTADARSDLFSVGIILWECLTGRRLFRAETTAATLNKLLHEPIAPPSSIDGSLRPLDEVVMRALQRDPDKRFQSAEEFVEALELAARAIGGLGSLRAVSKVVRQLAAGKLRRDKNLIEDAKRMLQQQPHRDNDGFEIDSVSEPSMPSFSEVSMSAASAMSKISGVYTSPTSTGFPAADARASRPPLLQPPPPAGSLPAPPMPPSHADARAGGGTGLRLSLVLIALLVLIGAWLKLDQRDNVSVEPLAPLPEDTADAPPATTLGDGEDSVTVTPPVEMPHAPAAFNPTQSKAAQPVASDKDSTNVGSAQAAKRVRARSQQRADAEPAADRAPPQPAAPTVVDPPPLANPYKE